MAAVRKSISVRSLLGGKMSDQLASQTATADQGKFLAASYRGSRWMFSCPQAEILALPRSPRGTSCKASSMSHQAGSNTTVGRCDLPLQVSPKATAGQAVPDGDPFRGPCVCRRGVLSFRRDKRPREAPLLPSASPEERVVWDV